MWPKIVRPFLQVTSRTLLTGSLTRSRQQVSGWPGCYPTFPGRRPVLIDRDGCFSFDFAAVSASSPQNIFRKEWLLHVVNKFPMDNESSLRSGSYVILLCDDLSGKMSVNLWNHFYPQTPCYLDSTFAVNISPLWTTHENFQKLPLWAQQLVIEGKIEKPELVVLKRAS